MRQTAIATSVRLPVGADLLLNKVVHDLHISRATFMRNAILEKIEDALDIKQVRKILAKHEKKYSFEDIAHELGLED